jgi:DNA ligase-1
MIQWNDGETRNVPGRPYIVKYIGGIYSCSCIAWKCQSLKIDQRSCKHLRSFGITQGVAGAAIAAAPAVAPIAASASAGQPSATTGTIEARAAAAGRSTGVLLAETWHEKIDPTSWWMSIKLDGLRSEFTGKEFISRNGNLFYAPDYFLAGMPDIQLDGELYLDKDCLEDTMSIVRSQNGGDGWKKIRFMIFDAPNHPGTFEERIAYLNNLVSEGKFPPHVVVVKHEKCTGKQHLLSELDRATLLNEEGLMLRKPGSKYERRRSSSLLKVKKFSDMEVEVIGYSDGKGRHKGRLGGLNVKMPDGKTFTVGTGLTDKERDNPPPIGCQVTITYTTKTKYGVPKCSSFLRIRSNE